MDDRRRESWREEDEAKPAYKVVREWVTEEKRKAKTQITTSMEPIWGYTLVMVGSLDLAEFCKEESRKIGQLIYIVTDDSRKPSKSTNLELDRIGYHFKNSIVERGVRWLELKKERDELVRVGRRVPVNLQNFLYENGLRTDTARHGVTRKEFLLQVRQTIKELFPKIPSEDLEMVVHRAFAEGTDTVGNAKDMLLAQRVQLAVNAHIRHMHTPYDLILDAYKNEPDPDSRGAIRNRARQDIEQECRKRLVLWRGEAEVNQKEFEEILKEIIIIDDDEDADAEEHARVSTILQQLRIQLPSGSNSRVPSGTGRISSQERPGVNSYTVIDDDGDEGDQYEPPEIQEPEKTSTKPENTPELVHVRPTRTIPTRQFSTMDSLAFNSAQQPRTPGNFFPPHINPRADNTPYDSPVSDSVRAGRRPRPDSVLTSIETGYPSEGLEGSTKRKATSERIHERQPKVLIIDEVPESEIVYRRPGNHLGSRGVSSSVARPDDGDQTARLRYTNQSYEVFQHRGSKSPDPFYENRRMNNTYSAKYTRPTRTIDQANDVVYEQASAYPRDKVFYELPPEAGHGHVRPMRYRELPVEYMHPRRVYQEVATNAFNTRPS